MIRSLTSIGIAMGYLNLLQGNDRTLKSTGFVLHLGEMHDVSAFQVQYQFLHFRV